MDRGIADGKVEVTIAVHITPGHTGGGGTLSGRPDGAGRQHAAVVAVHPIRLAKANATASIADDEVEVAIAVHIAPGHTVGVVTFGGRPDRTGGQHPTVVAIHSVLLTDAGITCIADGEVKIAVAIHVAPGHTGSPITLGG